MFPSTTVSVLLGVVAVLGVALPALFSTTVDIANTHATWQVRAQTFTTDDCGGAYTFLWLGPDICVDFAADVRSLRVVGHDGPLRYNSLNTYSAIGCHSGPSLEPLDRNCYVISDEEKSIKLRTHS